MKPKQRAFDIRGFLWGGIGLLLFTILIATVVYRQALNDIVVAYQYRDDPVINTYADRLKTSDKGRFLLRASRAEVNDRNAFNNNCSGLVEQTAVLGCYSAQRIYVYNIDNPQLAGIREVTMAHELLHAAYERLDVREKSRINELLRLQYEQVTDERFRETVKSYESLEPGEHFNELHSMLATEQASLSPELEQYYAQYFTDRQSIVAMAEQYEKVFVELEEKQKELVKELDGIAAEMEQAVPAYERSAEQLMSDIEAFNRRANSGDFSSQTSFNAARATLVARQNTLETERFRINSAIDRYEAGKKELDALNLQASNLHKSIDSVPTRELPTL